MTHNLSAALPSLVVVAVGLASAQSWSSTFCLEDYSVSQEGVWKCVALGPSYGQLHQFIKSYGEYMMVWCVTDEVHLEESLWAEAGVRHSTFIAPNLGWKSGQGISSLFQGLLVDVCVPLS